MSTERSRYEFLSQTPQITTLSQQQFRHVSTLISSDASVESDSPVGQNKGGNRYEIWQTAEYRAEFERGRQ
jgi:hypothetical protein